MWRDVFLHNKDAVLDMLGRFNADLTSLQRMIERDDGQGLFDLFTRTRAIRKGVVEQGQDTAAPDFGGRAGGSWEEFEPIYAFDARSAARSSLSSLLLQPPSAPR